MNSKHLLWLLILLPAIALMGCEGDPGAAGLAGADGIDGTDGIDGLDGIDGVDGTDGANGVSPSICMDCHNDVADLQVQLEYAMSGHKEGLYVGYAGGRGSCSRCHSKQGFQRFAVGASAEDIVDPAAIDCATCHIVHPDPAAFDLRIQGPVEMIYDPTYTLDFADESNLCANCHQTRRPEPNIDVPGTTFEITSTHYGPHHGPQANVLEGVGFAEIAGSVAYPAPQGALHLTAGATCMTCHMAAYADNSGGHTWAPSLTSCNSCHATPDFDYRGRQTTTQMQLDTLRDRLVELGVVEYVAEDDAYEPVVGTYPMVQAQAFFNWIGLEEDRSLGVHNPAYFDALLTNSVEALAPTP